jgi:hypothetical protein
LSPDFHKISLFHSQIEKKQLSFWHFDIWQQGVSHVNFFKTKEEDIQNFHRFRIAIEY